MPIQLYHFHFYYFLLFILFGHEHDRYTKLMIISNYLVIMLFMGFDKDVFLFEVGLLSLVKVDSCLLNYLENWLVKGFE